MKDIQVIGEQLAALLVAHGLPERAEQVMAVLADPPAKIDTTLRGLVEVESQDGTSLMYATDYGLRIYREGHDVLWGDATWSEAEGRKWTVRKLTHEDIGFKVRRYREWHASEQEAFTVIRKTAIYNSDIADTAIDIATRGTYEQ